MPQASIFAGTSATAALRWNVLPLLLMVLLAVLGCAHVPAEDPSAPATVSPAPVPVPPPPAIPTGAVTPPPVAHRADRVPEPFEEASTQSPMSAAIVLSDRSPAYENVALELSRILDDFVIYNLADRSLDAGAAFSDIADSSAQVVIAIGLHATEQAMALSSVPVVYCQVFNIETKDAAVAVKGVAAIPPLSLQVKAWKRLDPALEDIGTILGEGHDELIAEAERATAEQGIGLHYRVAASDRETLYAFHRMVPEIDGFWLFPDNRVLSVPILEEMLRYASSHQVRVVVFTPTLLDMGAAMSATAVYADIAATVVSIADRIREGDTDSIPALSPLHEVDIRTTGETLHGAAAKGSP